MPYWKTPLVGMSGRPLRMGSGMTPGAPEIGCPPPSYIRDMLIARRALLGQKVVVSFLMVSLDMEEGWAPASIGKARPAVAVPAAARNCLLFMGVKSKKLRYPGRG